MPLRAEVERLSADILYEQERNANNAKQYSAEVERLRAAGQRCMEISTGLASAGIVGHADILDVLGAALRGGGE